MCFIGDGNNNMAHSLIEGAVKVGMDISDCQSPRIFMPNEEVRKMHQNCCKQNRVQQLQ